MWLMHNGQIHKMLNPIHIKRLKEEGAVEIEDPTAQDSLTVQEPSPEESLSSSEPSEDSDQTTKPLVSIEDDTEQENQGEAPVSDPSALSQDDGKKSKRNSKA